jgi:hypothetical protein
VIVELDRRLFERNWIREYPVNEILARIPDGIAAPDDEEIILVCELEGPFPKEIVKRVIRVEVTHHTLPRLAAPRDEPWNAYARGESNSTAHRDR